MARIGMVDYINVAPIYETWKNTEIPDSWVVIEDHPSALNAMLAADEIDLGFVSCFEYAARPELYQIYPDLSISATGPVGSVLLLSQYPPEALDGREIVLTGQSDTSIRLLYIILEQFYAIKPIYRVGQAYSADSSSELPSAVLAIGDDALRMGVEKRYPYIIDLSEVWHQRTGLPFVFSVVAVRQSFIDRSPDEARAVGKLLVECRNRGRKQMAEICERVAGRIPMDCSLCSDYLAGIEHDLCQDKRDGLSTYFEYLITMGVGSPGALPLKIFGG